MISSQESGRERLEGSMLAVCTDCRSMVLQVKKTASEMFGGIGLVELDWMGISGRE